MSARRRLSLAPRRFGPRMSQWRKRAARPALCALAALALAPFVALAAPAQEQAQPVSLPAPTGEYGVGTAVWHWIDARRADAAAGRSAPVRELMAQLWYPAASGEAEGARYRPLSADYAHVTAHSVAAAAFAADARPAPLIVLCPGRGTSKNFYTTLAEDLASRGYAVLALDLPAIGYVEFPDGRTVDPSPAYRPSFELITGPYEKVDAFFEPAVAIGVADLRFAVRQLERINRKDPARRLSRAIDFSNIGAFGHSLGGRICGGWAQADRRVRAYAAMEGVPPREVRRGGMRAASLMLYSSELPEEMALPNIREVYDHRATDAAIVRLEGFGHNSVTDRPLLWPQQYDYAMPAPRALDLTRRLLARFFDAYLRDAQFDLAQLSRNAEVTVIEADLR